MTRIFPAVSALFLALTAASPLWAKCQLDKVTDLPATVQDNRIYVAGSINSQPLLYQLGTANPQSIVLPFAAYTLGMRPVNSPNGPGTSYDLTGAEGKAEYVAANDVRIGNWHGYDVGMMSIGAVANFGHPKALAILGEDYLANYEIELDLRNNLIAFYQAKDCADDNLAYWAQNYNVVDFVKFDPAAPQIKFMGKIGGKDVTMLLDSAVPNSLLSAETARALGVESNSPGVVRVWDFADLNNKPIPTWLGGFKSFTLDQENIAPVKLAFANGRAFGANMILGFDFIRSHHLLISHSQRKMYFSYSGGPPFETYKPPAK